jgi:restriction system protein
VERQEYNEIISNIDQQKNHDIISLSEAMAWQAGDPEKIIAPASWRGLAPSASSEIVRYIDDDEHDVMLQAKLDDENAQINRRLSEILGQHIETLQRKRRQLVFKDDYGNECYDKWFKELEYVAERMLVNDVILSGFDIYDSPTLPKVEYLSILVDVFLRERCEGNTKIAPALYRADMEGSEFEKLVASIFQDAGAEVSFTPVTGDQGADLIAEFAARTIAVQCKRSISNIGNKAVQEVAAGRTFYETLDAWVVSDAQFTRSARQLAESLSVELVNYEEIPTRLERIFLTYGSA